MTDTCKNGKLQSPINIKSKNTQLCESNCDIQFYYRSSICNIINNDGNIILEYDSGSYINYKSLVYELDRVSFSIPASHSIDGSNYDMEMFLWHRSMDIGKVLVVSVFIDVNEASSMSKGFFHLLENILPKKSGTDKLYNTPDDWNIFNTLPENKAFYIYSGSLPHKPCTENVTWVIMDSSVNISRKAYQNIKNIIGKNSRQLQRVHSRTIYYNPNNNPKNNRNYGSKLRCYTDAELRRKCQCMCKNGNSNNIYPNLSVGKLLFLLVLVTIFCMIYVSYTMGLFDNLFLKLKDYLHSKPVILKVSD